MEENNNNQSLKVLDRLSKDGQFVSYLYRKISRISKAIYLVTDIIKDTEPVKWEMRRLATDILSLNNFLDEGAVFNDLERSLLDLESLLDLARSARVVSSMNAEVIQNEVKKLIDELLLQRNQGGHHNQMFDASFFEVPRPTPVPLEDLINGKEGVNNYKGHVVRYDLYNKLNHAKTGQSDRALHTTQTQPKGHRREEILKIIRHKGSVTIRDIAEAIKDCSEKTVQRELLAMVEEGSIKRTGERRWSKYSI